MQENQTWITCMRLYHSLEIHISGKLVNEGPHINCSNTNVPLSQCVFSTRISFLVPETVHIVENENKFRLPIMSSLKSESTNPIPLFSSVGVKVSLTVSNWQYWSIVDNGMELTEFIGETREWWPNNCWVWWESELNADLPWFAHIDAPNVSPFCTFLDRISVLNWLPDRFSSDEYMRLRNDLSSV